LELLNVTQRTVTPNRLGRTKWTCWVRSERGNSYADDRDR
jgi:hypothetical protein